MCVNMNFMLISFRKSTSEFFGVLFAHRFSLKNYSQKAVQKLRYDSTNP